MKPTPVASRPRPPKAEPVRADEAALGLPQEHDRHPLLEAATLAGTAGGAAIGAIAGPVGVIAGGAIGAAIGMLGGRVLDEEDARTSHHDAELDDAIGVTAGPLGAKEAARRGLAKGDDADAEDGLGEHVIEASSLLRREHARLEVIYGALLDAYRSDDWNEVRAQWRMFEPALVAHMDLEERRILPFFREVDPKTADELVGEHRELRRLLEIFGVNLELHAVNARTAEALVMRLRRHGEREEDVLYPWVDGARHLDLGPPETSS